MPVKIIRRPGIERNPDLLRLVLQVWPKTDHPYHASEALSYLTGLAKVKPLGTASREIRWLHSLVQTKQEMLSG